MNTGQPPSLQAFQQALGSHLRDPRRVKRPEGVPARRAGLYGELMLDKLAGLLCPCFPVTQAVLGLRWPRLVRQFCREGQCQTPLFREVPGEFVRWLLATPDTDVPLPPWLRELVHHEWSELAVETAPFDEAPGWVLDPAVDAHGHWHGKVPRPNPAMMNLHYQWPVHRIGPRVRPRKPVPTFMLVYRDRDEQVCFVQLNAVSSRLLHLACTSGLSARRVCDTVAAELGQPDSPQLVAQGLAQLQAWRTQGVLWDSGDAENNDAT
jgi:hypothetical protein